MRSVEAYCEVYLGLKFVAAATVVMATWLATPNHAMYTDSVGPAFKTAPCAAATAAAAVTSASSHTPTGWGGTPAEDTTNVLSQLGIGNSAAPAGPAATAQAVSCVP